MSLLLETTTGGCLPHPTHPLSPAVQQAMSLRLDEMMHFASEIAKRMAMPAPSDSRSAALIFEIIEDSLLSELLRNLNKERYLRYEADCAAYRAALAKSKAGE